MGALITFSPGGPGPGSIAKLVWATSQGLLEAAAQGHRDAARRLGIWLLNTRDDPRCTPAVARTIDRAIEAAQRRLSPADAAPPAAAVIQMPGRFHFLHPDGGAAA